MKWSVARALVLGVLAITVPAVRAAAEPITLATALITSGGSTFKGDHTGRFIFAVTPIASVQLFSDNLLSAADVGRTFVADASTDPDFAEVARQLTNGVGNYVETQFARNGGIGAIGYPNEGILFGLNTLDLAGSTITGFTFRLDDFSAGPFDDRFDMLRVSGVLTVLGTNGGTAPAPTPEPGTLVLLATGIGAIAARRHRHRQDRLP